MRGAFGAARMRGGAFSRQQASRPRWQELVQRGGTSLADLGDSAAGHRAILRAVPTVLERRFDPTRAAGLTATFQLTVPHPGGRAPTHFTLRVADRTLTVIPGPAPEAGARVEASAGDMVRLITGVTGWPQLLGARQLRLSGDPFLGLRFPSLFRLPAGPG